MIISKGWIWVVVSIFFNILANGLLKYDSQIVSRKMLGISSGQFIALAFYGINFLAYSQALKSLNLSVAYPVVVGLSILAISFFGVFMFSEKLNMVQYFGLAAILIGVVCVSLNSYHISGE